MTYTFQPRGVCSRAMTVEVDDQGVIRDLQVVGGWKGMKAEEAIARLKGINCGGRGTSCPDQFARGLEAAMAQK